MGGSLDKSLIVGCMQPTLLSPPSYVSMIAHSDVFCLLSDVQFEKKSWQSRQRILTVQGETWLRIPCLTSGKQTQRIDEVEIDHSNARWADKQWQTLEMAYKKAPYGDYLQFFERFWANPPRLLIDFTQPILQVALDLLHIETTLVRSSNLGPLATQKEDHIIDIVLALGGDTLLDTVGAKTIIDETPFRAAGVDIRWHGYECEPYQQHNSREFVPYMGIIDLLVNEGPNALNVVLAGSRWPA